MLDKIDNTKLFTIRNVVAVALIIIGLIWIFQGIYRNSKAKNIVTWPRTKATVTSALIKPMNNAAGYEYLEPDQLVVSTRDNGAKYMPLITYTYNIGGRSYQSNQIAYGNKNSYNALDTKTIMGNLEPGSEIFVYYNLRNPSESYIYSGATNYWTIVWGVVFVILGLYVAYTGFKTNADSMY